jgi:hypothetical protein
MVQINFNGSNITPQFGFPTYPDGWLHLRVVGSEIVKTQADDNMLAFRTVGVMPPVQGQEGRINFNLWNKNPKVCESAAQQLAALCIVCGIPPNLPDSDALINREFFALNQKKPGVNFDNWVDVKTVDGRSAADVVKSGGPQAGGGMGGMPAQQQQPPMSPQPPGPAYQAQGQPPGPGMGAPQQQGTWGAPQGQPQQQPGVAPGMNYGAPQPAGQSFPAGQQTQAAPMPSTGGTWQQNTQAGAAPGWGNPTGQ